MVSLEAAQSSASLCAAPMRMVREIETLLSSNAPADALSLQDLALLLESFELKRAMLKKQVAAPAPPLQSPKAAQPSSSSSGADKKRLSLGALMLFPCLPCTHSYFNVH